jgi:hypothetical protein
MDRIKLVTRGWRIIGLYVCDPICRLAMASGDAHMGVNVCATREFSYSFKLYDSFMVPFVGHRSP